MNIVYLFCVSLSLFIPGNIAAEEGYGETWINFPDGDGTLHKVDYNEPFLVPEKQDEIDDVHISFYQPEFDNDEYNIYGGDPMNDFPVGLHRCDDSVEVKICPVKIIAHGWKSSPNSESVKSLVREYFKKQGDPTVSPFMYNVFALNWSSVANNNDYPVAGYHTTMVGHQVALILKKLFEVHKVPPEDIHLIGHSMGAHVMATAAFVYETQIGRLTALDPARPMFESPPKFQVYLNNVVAKFVDVIHTCSGVLGFENPAGQADFYPFEGKSPQPGCQDDPAAAESCSHRKSYEYYAQSIDLGVEYQLKRRGEEGDNGYNMGEDADPEQHGIFDTVVE